MQAIARAFAFGLRDQGQVSVLAASAVRCAASGSWDRMAAPAGSMLEVLEGKDYSFPKEEEKVLKLWEELDAFKTQLKLTEGKPEYIFYDGPPFATGLPHYGHILAGTIKVGAARMQLAPPWLRRLGAPAPAAARTLPMAKARRRPAPGAAAAADRRARPLLLAATQDIVTRYASTTGHHVIRRFGWDCHGLPVEYEIDKKLSE